MAKMKVFSAEQNNLKLRKGWMLLSQGNRTKESCRMLEIIEQPHCRWRKEYRGLDTNQAEKGRNRKRQCMAKASGG